MVISAVLAPIPRGCSRSLDARVSAANDYHVEMFHVKHSSLSNAKRAKDHVQILFRADSAK